VPPSWSSICRPSRSSTPQAEPDPADRCFADLRESDAEGRRSRGSLPPRLNAARSQRCRAASTATSHRLSLGAIFVAPSACRSTVAPQLRDRLPRRPAPHSRRTPLRRARHDGVCPPRRRHHPSGHRAGRTGGPRPHLRHARPPRTRRHQPGDPTGTGDQRTGVRRALGRRRSPRPNRSSRRRFRRKHPTRTRPGYRRDGRGPDDTARRQDRDLAARPRPSRPVAAAAARIRLARPGRPAPHPQHRALPRLPQRPHHLTGRPIRHNAARRARRRGRQCRVPPARQTNHRRRDRPPGWATSSGSSTITRQLARDSPAGHRRSRPGDGPGIERVPRPAQPGKGRRRG